MGIKFNSTIAENDSGKNKTHIYIIVILVGLVVAWSLQVFFKLLTLLLAYAIEKWMWAVGFILLILFLKYKVFRRKKKE